MKKVERDIKDLIERLRKEAAFSSTDFVPDDLLTEAADALSETFRKSERRGKHLRRRHAEEHVIVGDLQGWYQRAIEAEDEVERLKVELERVAAFLTALRREESE